MSSYDEVLIKCPACGAIHTIQSKAGLCELKIFDQSEVPHAIASSIAKYYTLECGCGVVSRPRKIKQHLVSVTMRPV